MSDKPFYIFDDRDELIFKTLVSQVKSLNVKAGFLEDHGISIEQLDEASNEVEETLLTLFGVPEDNTPQTMIHRDDGSVEYLTHVFCRDTISSYIWDFINGDIDLKECYETFQKYLNTTVTDYKLLFPEPNINKN